MGSSKLHCFMNGLKINRRIILVPTLYQKLHSFYRKAVEN